MNARLSWSVPLPARLIPLAGLALLALVCAPRAFAQYPGGYPGYPGYGSPAPGWHPLKPAGTPNGAVGNDTLGDPNVFYDYDWTHLTLAVEGTATWSPYPFYSFSEDYPPGTSSGFQYVGSFSGSPQDAPPRFLYLGISGLSTLKYKWVAPDDPITHQPDLAHFPAPSLFMLGRVDVLAEAWFNTYPPDSNGITGNGSAWDGFGDSWNPSFETVPGQAPGTGGEQTRRGIMSASGSPAVVTMAPGLQVNVYGNGTGSAVGGGTILERAFPLVLSSPNPLTNPKLGDGSNQSVYDNSYPDGFLYVPGAINVAGGGHDDAQWLLDNNQVDMAIVNSTIPNTFTHQWAVSGSTIYVNTPQNTDNPYPNYQFNRWIFKGLPSSFSTATDGNHDVNLYVQGNLSQTAHIQTFYRGLEKNWPDSDGITPNWFHYYEQAYPTSAVYNPDLTAGGRAEALGGWDENGNNVINATLTSIGPWQYQRSRIPVFAVNPANNYLDVIGELQATGIYEYIAVSKHELEHIALLYSNDVVLHEPDGYMPPGKTDTDGDSIPDDIEAKYHLNPKESNTTDYYQEPDESPDGGREDVECLCDIVALGQIIQNKAAWQKDWADFGVQYGPRPDYFPFMYIPKNIAQTYDNRCSVK